MLRTRMSLISKSAKMFLSKEKEDSLPPTEQNIFTSKLNIPMLEYSSCSETPTTNSQELAKLHTQIGAINMDLIGAT